MVARVTCGACGPNLFTPRPAAPASWRYDAPWGELTSTGEDCGSFTLPRGKERGRAHSEAMSSSLVHAFPPNLLRKTLQRTLVCVDHSASARLIFGPCICSSMLPLSVCFLFITAHPACAVSVHTSSLRFSLFHSSVDDVISSPSVRPLLGAFSFFFLASLLFPPQMNLRARPPPPLVDFVRRCWGLYIFF